MTEEIAAKKKKRSKKHRKTIKFDEESVTKDVADKLILEASKVAKVPKKKKVKTLELTAEVEEPPKKKKKRNANKPQSMAATELEVQDELDPTKPAIKSEESIRARKRRRHAELEKERRLKCEAAMQTKCLNYLSRWKHAKSEWKFEKMRQVWLGQNLFDDAKVPQEFWETAVEYFGSAKGRAREELLKEALKIVETEGEDAESAKYTRARELVQSLQE